MSKFIIREISGKDIEKELELIGFDSEYRIIASKKFKYKNIKIFDLTSTQANIIKQTALSVGADCGTHRDVITGTVEFSNVILGGSFSQLENIANKLKKQPFSLNELADDILNSLKKQKRITKIIGILNVTPNSFSDGGLYLNPDSAKKHLIQMIEDGADGIDIGAESTKPYSESVSADEQIKRLKPIFNFIQKENITIPISVDTRNAAVADFALNNGAVIVNDVSGLDYDPDMINIISKYKAGIIIQHSAGTPDVMQNNPLYENIIDEIYLSLKNKVELAKSFGIKNIIIDPGIGFGKTKEDNFKILNKIEDFYSLNIPIMIGVSRKSLLGITNNDNDLKDTLSAVISYPLIQKEIDYLRVHNVKLHKTILNIL